MKNNFELPMILSAKELQTMGFSRSMAYRLLQCDLIPVVTIGKRRFIRHTTLMQRLAQQEKTSASDISDTEDALLPFVCDEEGDDTA
ncbi:MAG: helix-turn-helix domain-containing protein [Oscillospiraceae bacterium]|nr:helix-turn-helix domain-containing protein [Oscillospiraceae bacterium]